MTNYSNTIREAITSALGTIRAAQQEAFAYANQQKASLVELLIKMRDTAHAIHDMSAVCGDAGAALLDIAKDSVHVAEAMDDSTYDFDLIPEGSYEGLVGFCDECGREIRADEKYDALDNGDLICSDCMTEPDTAETEPAAVTDSNPTDSESVDVVEETVEA